MPLTPSYGDRRVGPLVRLYRRAERKLLQVLAQALAPGIGPALLWANRMLMRLFGFRRDINTIIEDTDRELPTRLTAALTGAWKDGAAAARADLPPTSATADERVLRDLIDDTLNAVRATHQHVPRVLENVYRRVIHDAVRAEQATGVMDRDQVVQRALDQFARRGITGFVDSRGRRYDLVSYVETAVRAAISRAEVDAYCAQLVAGGHDLFVVSDVAGSCELCRPFEGACISITGNTIGAIARDNSTGRSVTVTVMCSLAEARARGLFHRGCRHTISVWTPDDPAPPRAVRVPAEVRERRRRQRAATRRDHVRERVGFVALS